MINETHFGKKLNRELSENKPEGLKDENLSVFNEFIGAIDGVSIENLNTAPTDGHKFIVEPQIETINTARGTVDKPAMVAKTATRLKIKIAPGFSMNDVPALIKEIEENHNQAIETVEGGMVLEITRSISESYLFWARQLNTIASRVPEAIRPRFNEYVDKLVELATIYNEQNATSKRLEDLTDIDFPNVSIWTKSVEGKKAISRWNDFIEGPMNEYKDQPERLSHMMDLIDSLVVIPNVKESLDYNLAQTIFRRGEKEMWQLSDVPEVFKREFKPKNIREFFESRFFEEWNALDNMRNKLVEAKGKKDVRQISRLQREIAERVMTIIDSDKFWTYKADEYRISEISTKREINCMARTAIIHNVFKEFFGEETLGGGTSNHLFPVLKLADGSLCAIDKTIYPQKLSNTAEFGLQRVGISRSPNRHYVENNWIHIGNHEKDYQEAVWIRLMKPNNYKFAFEQAHKLVPDSPNPYMCLINYLDKSETYPEREKDMEKAILTVLELTGDNPFYFTVAGNFYNNPSYKNDPRKSIEYYRKALTAMDKNPGMYNKWSVVQIEEKLREVKAKLKQK